MKPQKIINNMNSKIMTIIHKYGLFYSVCLFVMLLLHNEIKLNNINFYLFVFCSCLNMYFMFYEGMVFAMIKQNDITNIKDEIIERIAKDTMREIEKEEEEDNNNKLN